MCKTHNIAAITVDSSDSSGSPESIGYGTCSWVEVFPASHPTEPEGAFLVSSWAPQTFRSVDYSFLLTFHLFLAVILQINLPLSFSLSWSTYSHETFLTADPAQGSRYSVSEPTPWNDKWIQLCFSSVWNKNMKLKCGKTGFEILVRGCPL